MTVGPIRHALALVVALVAWAGNPAHSSAYRTLSDDPSFETTTPPAWASAPLAFDIYADLPSPLPGTVEVAAHAAAAEWSTAECSSFRSTVIGPATHVAQAGDGRNTITIVTSRWSDLGRETEAGATTDIHFVRGPDGLWVIDECDIYVDWEDRSFDASGVSTDGFELRRLLEHEMGHCLGLMHSCSEDGSDGPICTDSDRTSVMQAVYTAYSSPGLGPDDIAGVCAIYPLCERECAAGEACIAGACRPAECADATCEPVPQECEGAGECGPRATCAIAGPREATCVAPGAEGAVCISGEDCASSLCLAGPRSTPYCARPCETDAACEDGEICRTVEDREVCAPPPRSGCSASTVRSSTLIPLVLVVGLSVVLRDRRRCRNA